MNHLPLHTARLSRSHSAESERRLCRFRPGPQETGGQHQPEQISDRLYLREGGSHAFDRIEERMGLYMKHWDALTETAYETVKTDGSGQKMWENQQSKNIIEQQKQQFQRNAAAAGRSYDTYAPDMIRRMSAQEQVADRGAVESKIFYKVDKLEAVYRQVENYIAQMETEITSKGGTVKETLQQKLQRVRMLQMDGYVKAQEDHQRLQSISVDLYSKPFTELEHRTYHLLRLPRGTTVEFPSVPLQPDDYTTIEGSGGSYHIKYAPGAMDKFITAIQKNNGPIDAILTHADRSQNAGTVSMTKDGLRNIIFSFPSVTIKEEEPLIQPQEYPEFPPLPTPENPPGIPEPDVPPPPPPPQVDETPLPEELPKPDGKPEPNDVPPEGPIARGRKPEYAVAGFRKQKKEPERNPKEEPPVRPPQVPEDDDFELEIPEDMPNAKGGDVPEISTEEPVTMKPPTGEPLVSRPTDTEPLDIPDIDVPEPNIPEIRPSMLEEIPSELDTESLPPTNDAQEEPIPPVAPANVDLPSRVSEDVAPSVSMPDVELDTPRTPSPALELSRKETPDVQTTRASDRDKKVMPPRSAGPDAPEFVGLEAQAAEKQERVAMSKKSVEKAPSASAWPKNQQELRAFLDTQRNANIKTVKLETPLLTLYWRIEPNGKLGGFANEALHETEIPAVLQKRLEDELHMNVGRDNNILTDHSIPLKAQEIVKEYMIATAVLDLMRHDEIREPMRLTALHEALAQRLGVESVEPYSLEYHNARLSGNKKYGVDVPCILLRDTSGIVKHAVELGDGWSNGITGKLKSAKSYPASFAAWGMDSVTNEEVALLQRAADDGYTVEFSADNGYAQVHKIDPATGGAITPYNEIISDTNDKFFVERGIVDHMTRAMR